MSPGTVHATDVILMICCYTVHLALNGGDYLVGGTSHRNLLWRGGRARKQQATDGGGRLYLLRATAGRFQSVCVLHKFPVGTGARPSLPTAPREASTHFTMCLLTVMHLLGASLLPHKHRGPSPGQRNIPIEQRLAGRAGLVLCCIHSLDPLSTGFITRLP